MMSDMKRMIGKYFHNLNSLCPETRLKHNDDKMKRQEWVREGVLLTEATEPNLNLLRKSRDNLTV